MHIRQKESVRNGRGPAHTRLRHLQTDDVCMAVRFLHYLRFSKFSGKGLETDLRRFLPVSIFSLFPESGTAGDRKILADWFYTKMKMACRCHFRRIVQ